MIQIAEQLAPQVGLTTACAVLTVPRSSLYRARQPQATPAVRPTVPPVRQLSEVERQVVHTTLNSERFQDCAPRQVYATLLDEGRYLCSVSSLYRILAEDKEIRERRDQVRHPNYTKPELLATAPIRSGVGTSLNCWDPPNGPTIICM
jgi:putative transposase